MNERIDPPEPVEGLWECFVTVRVCVVAATREIAEEEATSLRCEGEVVDVDAAPYETGGERDETI